MQTQPGAGPRRPSAYLVPGVGAVGRVDEDGDDLGLGDEGSSSLGSFLRMEIVGTLLKQEVGGDVGRSGEEIHVPWRGRGLLELAQKGHGPVLPISWRVRR